MNLRTTLFTILAAALLALVAHAEIIFFKDGRMMQVEVVTGDERGIEVRRLDTQGRIFVRWNLLREEDRKRLRIRFGLQEDDSDADLIMDGHRVFVRKGDYYDGLVMKDDQEQLILRTASREMTFLRAAIRRVEEREVSVFDVYTEQELYDRRLTEVKPSETDVAGQFEMARWATKVSMFEKAIVHFGKVSQADPTYRTEYVANQVERLDVLRRNKAVTDGMKEAERAARRHRYEECFGILDTVVAAPDIAPSLKVQIKQLREKFEKRRWEHFRTLISREYQREAIKRIDAIARSRDIRARDKEKRMTIDKAMNHVRSKLHQEIVAHFAETHSLDPKKEVEKMWKERKKGPKRSASYNSGTFIVEGSKGGNRGNRARNLQNQAQQLAEALRGRRGGNNQQQTRQQAPPPKLVDKNEWWLGQSSTVRSYWLRAYFAENGKQLEVISSSRRACPTCAGQGFLKEIGPQGGFVRVTCPRCQGTRGDKIVTFR